MSPTHGPADVRQGIFRREAHFPFMFFQGLCLANRWVFQPFPATCQGYAQIAGCYLISIRRKKRRDDNVIYSAFAAKYFHNSNRVKSPQFQEGKITIFSIGSLSVLFASIMFLPCTPHFAVVEFARFRSRSLEQFFRGYAMRIIGRVSRNFGRNQIDSNEQNGSD
jgi:hypothetical protein